MNEDETTARDRATPDAPTVVDKLPSRPRARRETKRGSAKTEGASTSAVRSRGSGSRSTRTGTVTNPAEAVRSDEMARSRALALVGMSGSAAASLVAPFFGVEAWTLGVLLVGMACLFFSNAYLWWVASEVDRYTEGRLVVIWVVATLGLLGAVFFFGPLSGATACLILGIYISARNASRKVSRATYVTIAVVHGLFVALPLMDLAPRVGVIQPTALDPLEIALGALMLQLIFFGTYAAASSSQRAMVEILDDLDGAAREVARREALLDEAREELGRVLPVGGAGRLTGVELGSFRLGVLIGRGGMGEVYEAEPIEGGEPAAVKVLLPRMLSNEEGVVRFLREARVASSLASDHVVRVVEIGEPPDELPYIAMERLRGHDLSTYLRERGAMMEPAEVVDLVRQIGRGLAAAHEAGIVHRDIKPQNVYRARAPDGEAPRWKLLDFGVSKLRDSEGTLTQGKLLGTPTYMAPEQALGEDVDHRADVYSLGAVAYRCIVGRPPFRAGETARVVYRVVHRMPARPSALAPLSDHVDRVLAIALAKSPEDRFDSGEALADALGRALDGEVDRPLRERAARLLDELPWSS